MEEPIQYEGILHYFNTSLAKLCLFQRFEEPGLWITGGQDTMELWNVGPRWERLMRYHSGCDADDIYWIGVTSEDFRWTLDDVRWYHANHTDELGWWTSEEATWVAEHYGKPISGRGYKPWEQDEI